MRTLRTTEETAVILSVMMTRANVTRARISDKTIKLVSGRKQLRESFRITLNDDISEYGFLIVDLYSGGQAIIKISALEAAKSFTAKSVLTDAEIKDLKKGTLDLNIFRDELKENEDDNNDFIE
jgi:hypothetical protein